MKIAFLCGSLEPGRDGVGDYIRRLASKLLQHGHQVVGIALNDQHITEEVSSLQQIKNDDFLTFRFPSIWPATERFDRARYWVNNFNPEWLSLQFVPFSFHPRGLPFGLGRQLVKLGEGKLLHIMIHELWVGMERESSAKHMYWGKIQKYLIKSLITQIKPKIIHTQILLYKSELARLGFISNLLPLFSNIPNNTTIINNNPTEPGSLALYKNEISLIVFGHIHPGAPINQFAYDASQYAKQHGVVIILVMIGRCGKEQEHWAAQWEAINLPVKILGEQNAKYISSTLLTSSLGIATNPIHLIGKSGTAAAMREHGLPIICVSRPWNPRDIKNLELPSNIYVYSEGEFAKYMDSRLRLAAPNDISDVSKQLVTDLLTAIR